jgi:hypothetical protein
MLRSSNSSAAWILPLTLQVIACAAHDGEPAEAKPGTARTAKHPLVTKPWHVSPGWAAYSLDSSELFFDIPWSKVLELRPGMRAAEVEHLVGPLEFVFGHNAVVFATFPEDGLSYEVAMKFSYSNSVLEDVSYLRAQEFGSLTYRPTPKSSAGAANK